MNRIFFLLPLLLLGLPAKAKAQVTVNQAALAQLAGIVAPGPVVVAAPVVRHVVHRRIVHHARPPVAEAAAVVARPVVARPVVARPAPVPEAPAPLAVASIDFAAGSAALPAAAAGALKPFCGTKNTIGVDAAAPNDPNDPSAGMRLAMERAFAVRDALAACGVPAQNILPRAASGAKGAAADVTRLGPSP